MDDWQINHTQKIKRHPMSKDALMEKLAIAISDGATEASAKIAQTRIKHRLETRVGRAP